MSEKNTVKTESGIEVYEDKILVLGRDFTNSKWIPSACFIANI